MPLRNGCKPGQKPEAEAIGLKEQSPGGLKS